MAVQLKLFDSPLRFDKNAEMAGKALKISMEVLDASANRPEWHSANVSVSQLIPDQSKFVKLAHGVDYSPDTMITFFVNTTKPESTVSDIDP